MKHKNIFQNRLKSYSEKIHFFSDQTLDIYKFLNTMIFLSVNHNLLYTILGTYPPGPFRSNQNSPKKFPFFQHFQQHFSSAEISSMQNFSSAGNLLERPTVVGSEYIVIFYTIIPLKTFPINWSISMILNHFKQR